MKDIQDKGYEIIAYLSSQCHLHAGNKVATITITVIASSAFYLPCGFTVGVCLTWCWMTRKKRQQQEQKQSPTAAEREQVCKSPPYEEVDLEDQEMIEVEINAAYGPSIL